MARNYASISTGMWREDFRNLTSSAQRTYMMLFSQPDITAVGMLSLTIGRWSSLATDTTIASIRADLAQLQAHRFIAYDEISEELLVRTFVKWDHGYANPKRRPVILHAAQDVLSIPLRRILAVEFARLGLPTDGLVGDQTPPDRPSGRHSDSPSNGHTGVENEPASWEKPNWDMPTSMAGFAQVNNLSDTQPDNPADTVSPSQRVVGSKALEVQEPFYLNPQTTTPPPLAERQNPEEGESGLVEEIKELRPEWSEKSIERALTDETVTTRPPDIVAAAMRLVAADPASQSPGRLKADGPWWSTAALVVRIANETAEQLDSVLVHPYEPGPDGCCATCTLPEQNRRHQSTNVIPIRRTA